MKLKLSVGDKFVEGEIMDDAPINFEHLFKLFVETAYRELLAKLQVENSGVAVSQQGEM